MSELVTQAEYARRRGVSREAVRQALEAGRVSGVDVDGRVMIDPERADIEWARNTDPDQQQRGAPEQFERTQLRAEEALRGGLDDDGGAPGAPGAPGAGDALAPAEPTILVEAKAKTELLRQQMLEIDLAERLGELVRMADVERAYAARLVAAREALDALPDRLAAKLAATDDAARVHAMLAEEIRLAMAHLVPTQRPEEVLV